MSAWILAAESVPPQAWRNGGGVTRELLTWAAPGADAWQLRISVATIDRDGPFSTLPGIARWFAVLEGAGVTLDWGERRLALGPGDEAIAFDGAHAPECRLRGGSTRDLNLMIRDGTAGMLRGVPGMAQDLRGTQAGLYTCVAGHWTQDGADAAPRRARLAAHTLLWDALPPVGCTWRFEPEAAADLPSAMPPATGTTRAHGRPAHAGTPCFYWLEFDPNPGKLGRSATRTS